MESANIEDINLSAFGAKQVDESKFQQNTPTASQKY